MFIKSNNRTQTPEQDIVQDVQETVQKKTKRVKSKRPEFDKVKRIILGVFLGLFLVVTVEPSSKVSLPGTAGAPAGTSPSYLYVTS